MNEECIAGEALRLEEAVQERTDASGQTWRKVYFGGGRHLENWLSQCREIYSDDDIELEEVTAPAFACFAESGEKMCRIWVKNKKD